MRPGAGHATPQRGAGSAPLDPNFSKIRGVSPNAPDLPITHMQSSPTLPRCEAIISKVVPSTGGGETFRRTFAAGATCGGEDLSLKRILGLAIVASALASSAAFAAIGTPGRVHGTMEPDTVNSGTADTYTNKAITLGLTRRTAYLQVEKSNLSSLAASVTQQNRAIGRSRTGRRCDSL